MRLIARRDFNAVVIYLIFGLMATSGQLENRVWNFVRKQFINIPITMYEYCLQVNNYKHGDCTNF
jgi:hypothetical protein